MKVKLYTEPKKYIVIEVENEEQAKKVADLNRSLWREAKVSKKEIAMSRFQKNAEEDEERMEDKISDECDNAEEQYIAEEDRQERESMIAILKVAVKTLSADQQQIVQMKYYEDKNDTDISRALGISRQAVQNRLKKILERLKKNF